MSQPTLTPQQTALQQLALRQLENLSQTLQRLISITDDQGDREAVQDAESNTANSQELLRDWFGGSPETPFDESAFENQGDRCIDYESITIIAGSTLADTILDVVMQLPNDVSQWVVKNITFIDFTGISGLACHVATSFPSQHRSQPDFGGIRLLVIVSCEKDESDEQIKFRVAHEIAHHWLGHLEGSANTPEAYEQQEQEADSKADSWGFVGSSTRIV